MQVVQGVGGGISDMLNAYRNRKMEQRVIGVLNDPNMNAEQKRLQLLKDADFLRSPTGQKMMSDELSGQAAMQMQERQARLANLQAGTRATQARAKYYEQGGARKTATDPTIRIRRLQEIKNQASIDGDAEMEAWADGELKKLLPTQAQGPQGPVDAVTMASPSIQPTDIQPPQPSGGTQRELEPLTDEQARRNARPIASKEEYDALPPGSYFIASNGELRQKNG